MMARRPFLLDCNSNRAIEAFDRSIDVQISRLRQKLEIDANDPKLITTIRNGGYIFACKVQNGTLCQKDMTIGLEMKLCENCKFFYQWHLHLLFEFGTKSIGHLC